MGEEQGYCLADISTCHHCTSYLEHPIYVSVGVVYCVNPDSPYYHDGFNRTVKLIFETLPGCEHATLKERIPQRLYQNLPIDSPFRKLPLEEVISDWDGTTELMSTKTASQVLKEIREKKPSIVIKEMVPNI